MISVAIALATSLTMASEWTPRQAEVIKLANAVMESDSWALSNMCNVTNGRARYEAAQKRLKASLPKLEAEIGSYPVYEIFVVRAPAIGPGAMPPAKCKPLKTVKTEKEAIMVRYESAVDALAGSLGAS